MSYELFIALRYLTAKRKQTFVSVISLISILGVIVGVAALIIALALMTGFQQDIREKILGANAHLTVFGAWPGKPIQDPEAVVRTLRSVPGIAAASPVVLLKGLMVSDLVPGGTGVMLKGIRLAEERRVTDLAEKVSSGDLTALSHEGESSLPGIALGKDLAATLDVAPGDRVRVVLPQLQMTPFLPVPRSRPFQVVAIVDSGFYDYDSTRGYIDLREAQSLASLEGAVTVVEARLSQLSRLKEVGEEAQRRLGKDYLVNDLVAMNRTFFSALNLEKLLMSIAVGLIAVGLSGAGVMLTSTVAFDESKYPFKARYRMLQFGVSPAVLSAHTGEQQASDRRAAGWVLWGTTLQLVSGVLALIALLRA